MIKMILMNGAETEIMLPCREKELYDCLEKIGIPELIPPIVYVKEVISPKEYAGLAGKVQNLDEINYFAGYEENLIPADRVKLQAVVSQEKELTPKRLINLCFDLDRYELKQKGELVAAEQKGIETKYGFLSIREDTPSRQVYNGKVFPFCVSGDDETPLLIAEVEYGGESEIIALPCEPMAIKKMLHRLGAYNADDCKNSLEGFTLRPWIDIFKNVLEENNIYRVNEFAITVREKQINMAKLLKFIEYAGDESLDAILKLAEHINNFNYISEIGSYEKLGRYAIQNYLLEDLPKEFEECIDYEACGEIFADEVKGKLACGEIFADEVKGKFLNGGFGYMSGGKTPEDILSDADMRMGGIQ